MMRFVSLICAFSILSAQTGTNLILYEQTREAMERSLAGDITRLDLVILPAGKIRPNVYGDYAIGYGGQLHEDLSLPNPAFFQRLDWVIKKAESRKIQVRILVSDSDSVFLGKNSAEKWFDFGRYLGRRYMKTKNLVWLRLFEPSAGPLLSLEEGIRQFDSVHRFELFKRP